MVVLSLGCIRTKAILLASGDHAGLSPDASCRSPSRPIVFTNTTLFLAKATRVPSGEMLGRDADPRSVTSGLILLGRRGLGAYCVEWRNAIVVTINDRTSAETAVAGQEFRFRRRHK